MTTHNLAGTNGYIDPLYADSGQYSQTTDAYAMGVTLLVVLSGRRAPQAKKDADDTLEDLTDGAALQRALDSAAGWPEPAARELLGIVKGLYWERRQQRRMPLSSALETIERVCEDQSVRPGMAEPAADSDAPRMCVICMDAPRTTRFSPCGHSQCCEACADLVIRRGSGASRCPYCRTSIATMMTDPNIINEETFVAHS
jgi:interleukin-1 receptor-associated kinase 1